MLEARREQWRNAIREAVDLVQQRNWKELANRDLVDGSPLTHVREQHFERILQDYPGTITRVPDAAIDRAIAQAESLLEMDDEDISSEYAYYPVDIPIYTTEEGATDLVLELHVYEAEGRTLAKLYTALVR